MPTPEYVLKLREKVGHEMLWLTTAAGVVLDQGGRVLLGRRADNGAWALPGGIIDPAEHPADAAVREIFEETGVIAEPELLTEISVCEPIRYRNGDLVQYLEFAFRCRAAGGEARVADSESVEVGWFAPAELPPVSAAVHARITRALSSSEKASFTFSGIAAVLGPGAAAELRR
ncbi:MAG TPA: NUDIX domain-containing protein [Streptosporangiaceae bacterium]